MIDMPKIFDSSEHSKSSDVDSPRPKSKTEAVEKKQKTDSHKSDEKKQTVTDAQKKVSRSKVFRNEKPTRSVMAAYAPIPEGVCFSTQDTEEEVLLLLRQHPASQIGWVLVTILLIFLPFLFTSIGFFDFLPFNYFFAGLIGWYMLVTGYVLEAFLKWYYNVYIVTDERIIDIDFESLLYKNISAAKIDNIEDVTAQAKGVLSAIFDYGDIYLQTAAEKREFEFHSVPHPQQIKKVINELMLEEEQEKIEGRVR